MCDIGVAMKTTTTDDRISISRFVARFGGRFLCRSPPDEGGGPPRLAIAGVTAEAGRSVGFPARRGRAGN